MAAKKRKAKRAPRARGLTVRDLKLQLDDACRRFDQVTRELEQNRQRQRLLSYQCDDVKAHMRKMLAHVERLMREKEALMRERPEAQR